MNTVQRPISITYFEFSHTKLMKKSSIASQMTINPGYQPCAQIKVFFEAGKLDNQQEIEAISNKCVVSFEYVEALYSILTV